MVLFWNYFGTILELLSRHPFGTILEPYQLSHGPRVCGVISTADTFKWLMAASAMGFHQLRYLQNRTLFLPLRDNANLRPVSFRYLELFRPQRIALAWANCEFSGTDRMARPALAHISDVGKGNIEEDIEDIDRVFLRRKTPLPHSTPFLPSEALNSS